MTLKDWIDAQIQKRSVDGAKVSRKTVINELVERTGVSAGTIQNAYRGYKISIFNIGKAIEGATDGQVTLDELCEK